MKISTSSDGSGLVSLPSFSSVTQVLVNGVSTTSGYSVDTNEGVRFSPAPPVGIPIEITFVDNKQLAGVENAAAVTTAVSHDKIFDQVDSTTGYLGEAVCGSSLSSPSWRIKKFIFSAGGGVQIKHADGNANYDNVWADRATLTYP